MRHRARADDVRIEGDESGWLLEVDTEDGDTFAFRIHHLAWDLAAQAERTIGAWRQEGEALRGTRVRISDEDLEAYDLGDPKRISLEREMKAR